MNTDFRILKTRAFARCKWPAIATAGLMAMFFQSHAFAIVYTVDRIVGDGTVKGTIETDGTLGLVGSSEIVDWNLTLTNDGAAVDLLGPLSGDNSVFGIVGQLFEATADELSVRVSGGASSFQFCIESLTFPNVCNLGNENWVVSSTFSFLERIRDFPGKPTQTFGPVGATGDLFVIGTAMSGPPPSSVPVPAAAWLFLSAILGFSGIKRRKN